MECSILSHAILAILILSFSTHITSASATRLLTVNSNTQYLKASCSNTIYPKLCYKSLSSYATKIQSNPKMLAHVALSLTLTATKSASELIKNLSELHDLGAKEAAAVADCLELVEEAADELERSIGEMGRSRGSKSDPAINDIQTWVSASLTNDETCIDGFSSKAMAGEVKNIVRGNMTQVAHLTSISLAFINSFASSSL